MFGGVDSASNCVLYAVFAYCRASSRGFIVMEPWKVDLVGALMARGCHLGCLFFFCCLGAFELLVLVLESDDGLRVLFVPFFKTLADREARNSPRGCSVWFASIVVLGSMMMLVMLVLVVVVVGLTWAILLGYNGVKSNF